MFQANIDELDLLEKKIVGTLGNVLKTLPR